jgi:glycosyltransferase involved in cell wall biosynthesis
VSLPSVSPELVSHRGTLGSAPRARLYGSLRTAHLERALQLEPATILYRRRRYDFDESIASQLDLVQAGPFECARILFRSKVEQLEINEPLMVHALPMTCLALAALAARRVVGGQRVRVVSYAIENANPFVHPRSSRVRTWVDKRMARAVRRRVDRLAFGTGMAADLYRTIFGAAPRRSVERLIPALPAATGSASEKKPRSVIYLGSFAVRKGFPLVLQAWPAVVAARSGATLAILGKGELERDALASAGLDVSVVVDPPREEIVATLRRTQVLVLPSQPAAHWREQVGLPIVEGLAAGCTIVTTKETGLADWLAEHRHVVLAAPTTAAELADGIVAALDRNRTAADVLAALPTEDGRLEADRWLFGVDAHG